MHSLDWRFLFFDMSLCTLQVENCLAQFDGSLQIINGVHSINRKPSHLGQLSKTHCTPQIIQKWKQDINGWSNGYTITFGQLENLLTSPDFPVYVKKKSQNHYKGKWRMPSYSHNTRRVNSLFTQQPVELLVQMLWLQTLYRHYYLPPFGSIKKKPLSLQHPPCKYKFSIVQIELK